MIRGRNREYPETVKFPSDLSTFSPDYLTARTRFREAAAKAGTRLTSCAVTSTPAGDQELTIDIATLTGANPRQAVVVTSGLHGVEGHFGSALQVAWLEAMTRQQVPHFDGTLILIHALNPFGFHCSRRVDRDNIDLNRNFLCRGEDYSGMPAGYLELAPLLNPTGPPPRIDTFLPRAVAAVARHGLKKLTATIATGQYEFPMGLFFGGRKPGVSTKLVQSAFADWIGEAEQIVHLDLHTGLGKWATAKLLVSNAIEVTELAWYRSQFGDMAVEPLAPNEGIAYAARGVMGNWLREHLADRHYRSLVAEFGTHAVLRVFTALRRENRAFHFCEPEDPRRHRATSELVECFCPASQRWRQRVLTTGFEIIRAAQAAVGTIAVG